MSLINFLVDYEADGDPVVYKVDNIVMKSERNKEGGFEMNMEFDVHIATEEELKEYNERH